MSTDTSWVATRPETSDRCLGPALFAPFATRLGSGHGDLAAYVVLARPPT